MYITFKGIIVGHVTSRGGTYWRYDKVYAGHGIIRAVSSVSKLIWWSVVEWRVVWCGREDALIVVEGATPPHATIMHVMLILIR